MFEVNQVVNGKAAGTFKIIGLRTMHGEEGAQVKPVNPFDHNQVGAGELWFPLADLRAFAMKTELIVTLTSNGARTAYPDTEEGRAKLAAHVSAYALDGYAFSVTKE